MLWAGFALTAHAAPKTAKEIRAALAEGPAASAADIPVLATLLERAGWTPTPELSGVFYPGKVFTDTGHSHTLLVSSGCFGGEVEQSTYTAAEMVTSLQAGVSVGLGFARGEVTGGIVKKVKFGVPVHHTIPQADLVPTESCRLKLARLAPETLARSYVVQEVLTAEISEQTCGRVDASGRFVGLGAAEAELAQACSVASLEPVAVAYRTLDLNEVLVLGAVPIPLAPAVAPMVRAPAAAPASVLSVGRFRVQTPVYRQPGRFWNGSNERIPRKTIRGLAKMDPKGRRAVGWSTAWLCTAIVGTGLSSWGAASLPSAVYVAVPGLASGPPLLLLGLSGHFIVRARVGRAAERTLIKHGVKVVPQ
jgi:hypothetical protein